MTDKPSSADIVERLREFAAYGGDAKARILAQLALTEIERLRGGAATPSKSKFDETGLSKYLREIIGQETTPPLWIYVTKEQIPILETIADRLDWLESLYAPFITEHTPQPAIHDVAQPSIDHAALEDLISTFEQMRGYPEGDSNDPCFDLCGMPCCNEFGCLHAKVRAVRALAITSTQSEYDDSVTAQDVRGILAPPSQSEMENYRLALAWIKGQSTDPEAKEIAATALDGCTVTRPHRETK